jgi:ABC-type transport system involved in multi-copper enzyme maturation permease subunit
MLLVTLKGVFRDRVFQGIVLTSVLFLVIPSVSSLSMRQVTELSITLSLSLVSFILLVLSVFLGGVSLWRDIDRRYSFSVMGLPLKRSDYVLGKFGGTALFLLLVALFLWLVTTLAVLYASAIYPAERPVRWDFISLAILFDALKYLLLIAFAFLFSSVSTSFFLPIFGTISIFLIGSATQDVYEFVHSATGHKLPGLLRATATGLYYILPNFSAFNLKLNAVYGINVSMYGLTLTFCYFLIYTAALLLLATTIFSSRELK